MGAKTFNWEEISDNRLQGENEEILLTNTYLNSK